MKKLSKTIFTSPDDNFKNKRLPKNCTVITPYGEYRVTKGDIVLKETATLPNSVRNTKKRPES